LKKQNKRRINKPNVPLRQLFGNKNYELGRENYRRMLLCYEGITMPPEEILEIGLRELKREQDVFNAAAGLISPGKKC